MISRTGIRCFVTPQRAWNTANAVWFKLPKKCLFKLKKSTVLLQRSLLRNNFIILFNGTLDKIFLELIKRQLK